MSIFDYAKIGLEEFDLGETLPSQNAIDEMANLEYPNLQNVDKTFLVNGCYAITISPKSSPLFTINVPLHCSKCNFKNKTNYQLGNVDTDKQYMAHKRLFLKIKKTLKINFLLFFEWYKDNKFIHIHGIIKLKTKKQKYEVIKLIKDYYQIDSNVLVNIEPIKNEDNWTKYILKEQPNDHYPPICSIQRKNYNFKTFKKPEHDEIKEHLEMCSVNKCNLCQLIYDHYSKLNQISFDG